MDFMRSRLQTKLVPAATNDLFPFHHQLSSAPELRSIPIFIVNVSGSGCPTFMRQAFTLIEMLFVIGVILILVALLLPVAGKARERSHAIACVSQLRQVGIASISFARDHNGRFPASTMPNTNRFLSPFQAVVSELGSVKILHCPADIERAQGTNMGLVNRTNTSYFYSYTARADQPLVILAGDRNFTVDYGNGVMERQAPANSTNPMLLAGGGIFTGDVEISFSGTEVFIRQAPAH